MQKKDHDENEKIRKILVFSELERYTVTDIGQYFRYILHKLWMNLVSSGWFCYVLNCLSLKDIIKLDLAFCNHEDRTKWLASLAKFYIPYVKIPQNRFVVYFTNWLIQKKIRSNELKCILVPVIGGQRLVEESIIRLINNCCPSLNTLEIDDGLKSMRRFYTVLMTTFNCYIDLEVLKISYAEISNFGFELLSNTCHQLKVIHLSNIIFIGLEKLLTANINLINLSLTSDNRSNKLCLGNIFQALGQNCSRLQKCSILCHNEIENNTTNIQMETFTKGCRCLKYLNLDITMVTAVKTSFFDKLILCLGMYNPLIEELQLACEGDTVTSNSLKCFSVGCPGLKKFEINKLDLSTQGINYLINNTTQLEILILESCLICNDGITITKANDKLKYLQYLGLSTNYDITDESFVDLINGCHKLGTIDIGSCSKLTDTSLFSIAANCPDLKYLHFGKYRNNYFTNHGMNELRTKCPNLDLHNDNHGDNHNDYVSDNFSLYNGNGSDTGTNLH